MNINPPGQPPSGPTGPSNAQNIILSIGNQRIEIPPNLIKSISKKFSRLAKKLGQTNEEDAYADEMYDVIYKAYKVAEKQQKGPRR